jgi:hypothetical protein
MADDKKPTPPPIRVIKEGARIQSSTSKKAEPENKERGN